VREDEPSSIIAHGLDSQLYKDLMKESHNHSVASSSEVFMPESELGHGGNRSSNWDVLEFQTDAGTDLEEVMKKPMDRHLRLAWDDATLRYTIRVFFADQFDALRKNSGCQELFIESLARCHKWDAQGGKSGSAFLKTKGESQRVQRAEIGRGTDSRAPTRRPLYHQRDFACGDDCSAGFCAKILPISVSGIL
jgi:1-phosphatidylinositol-3-phosphate 5-kinase